MSSSWSTIVLNKRAKCNRQDRYSFDQNMSLIPVIALGNARCQRCTTRSSTDPTASTAATADAIQLQRPTTQSLSSA